MTTHAATEGDETELYLRYIHAAVEGHRPGWKIIDGRLIGPGTLAIDVVPHASDGVTHVDINFSLNRERADVPVIGDCTTGIGNDADASARFAVGQWARVTLHPIIELLQQQGTLAYHSDGTDGVGLPGWHCVIGDLSGWNAGQGSATEMQQWFGTAGVLPALGPALSPDLDGRALSWIRFFFGGDGVNDVAEIRVNSSYSEAASTAFWELPWPRPGGPAYLKMFVLVLPLVADPARQQ